jgi:hypothetical protein
MAEERTETILPIPGTFIKDLRCVFVFVPVQNSLYDCPFRYFYRKGETSDEGIYSSTVMRVNSGHWAACCRDGRDGVMHGPLR